MWCNVGGTRDCDDDGGCWADAAADVAEGWSGVRGGLEGGSVDAVELRLGLPMGLLLILVLWLSPGDDADDPGELLLVESSDNATLVGLPRPSSSSFLSTLLLPWRSSSSNGSVFVVAMVGFY